MKLKRSEIVTLTSIPFIGHTPFREEIVNSWQTYLRGCHKYSAEYAADYRTLAQQIDGGANVALAGGHFRDGICYAVVRGILMVTGVYQHFESFAFQCIDDVGDYHSFVCDVRTLISESRIMAYAEPNSAEAQLIATICGKDLN